MEAKDNTNQKKSRTVKGSRVLVRMESKIELLEDTLLVVEVETTATNNDIDTIKKSILECAQGAFIGMGDVVLAITNQK